MKKVLGLLALISSTITTQADITLNFNDDQQLTDISQIRKTKGTVSLQEATDNDKYLRVNCPKGSAKFKTGIKSPDNFSMSLDWRRNAGTGGRIFSLTGKKPKEAIFNFMYEKTKVNGTTFSRNKYKKRRILEAKKGVWYRFDINVKDGVYTVEVTDRGKKNSDDNAKLVYSSIERNKTLRINKESSPATLSFNTWGKKENPGFDYDNIVVRSN